MVCVFPVDCWLLTVSFAAKISSAFAAESCRVEVSAAVFRKVNVDWRAAWARPEGQKQAASREGAGVHFRDKWTQKNEATIFGRTGNINQKPLAKKVACPQRCLHHYTFGHATITRSLGSCCGSSLSSSGVDNSWS